MVFVERRYASAQSFRRGTLLFQAVVDAVLPSTSHFSISVFSPACDDGIGHFR
jgi:hypothetical protein